MVEVEYGGNLYGFKEAKTQRSRHKCWSNIKLGNLSPSLDGHHFFKWHGESAVELYLIIWQFQLDPEKRPFPFCHISPHHFILILNLKEYLTAYLAFQYEILTSP